MSFLDEVPWNGDGLIAAVEAILDPAARSDLIQAASGSAFPVVIVNGPLGKRIRLNSARPNKEVKRKLSRCRKWTRRLFRIFLGRNARS